MPIPSSATSLPEASLFGMLVATIATGKGPDSEVAPETPRARDGVEHDASPDVAAPFVVPQPQAQPTSPAPFPTLLIPGLERLQFEKQGGFKPEEIVPPSQDIGRPAAVENAGALAPQFERPAPRTTSDELREPDALPDGPIAKVDVPASEKSDSSEPRHTEPRDSVRTVALQPLSDKPLGPIMPPIQFAAVVGSSVSEAPSESGLDATIEAPPSREPSDRLPDRLPPASSTRTRSAIVTQLIAALPSRDLPERPVDSGTIPDEVQAFGGDQPEATHNPDRPKIADPPRSTLFASARAPDPLPETAVIAQTTNASAPTPPTDSISVPPPTANVSVPAETRSC